MTFKVPTNTGQPYLVKTESTNPDYYGGCDFAMIEVTPALLARIKTRAENVLRLREQERSLYELYFWGTYDALYFHGDLLMELEELEPDWPALDDAEWERAPAWFIEKLELDSADDDNRWAPRRTECEQMLIRVGTPLPDRDMPSLSDIEVAWCCIPKHSSVLITTAAIAISSLEALLLQKEQA